MPLKEGKISAYMDIDEITQNGKRPYATLMDNNILAAGSYGTQQLEKIAERGCHIDFNQGLDARLVDGPTASLLAHCKWQGYIRFGCDTPQQIKECEQAMELIRSHGYKQRFFLYCIINDDMEESHSRITYWRNRKDVTPFAQPFRDINNPAQTIPKWQKDMARWCNRKEIYRTTSFHDYQPRKNFTCKEYFTDK